MQAVALGQGNGQAYPPMRLFDIATLTRAGKVHILSSCTLC